jgi:hypothetical protein
MISTSLAGLDFSFPLANRVCNDAAHVCTKQVSEHRYQYKSAYSKIVILLLFNQQSPFVLNKKIRLNKISVFCCSWQCVILLDDISGGKRYSMKIYILVPLFISSIVPVFHFMQ